jgi:polysaccharide transporter, PST family
VTSLKKNIAFIYLLQMGNFLIPMITVPYLSRALGVRDFGVVGLAAGVISVMTLVTDWGFSLTATQKVAQHANNHIELRRLFWDVFWARLGLGCIAFAGLSVVMATLPSVRSLGAVMLAASVQVAASMLSVGWFLQGLEQMRAYVGTLLVGSVLAVPLTFMFVHGPGDVVAAVLIPGLCALFSAAISFQAAGKRIHLLPVRFSPKGMRSEIFDGAHIFISTGAINLYTQSNILILSAVTTSSQIGIYYGAERIRRAGQSLVDPAGAALFPRINNLMSHDRGAATRLMKNMLIIQGGFTFLLSLTMFALAPWGVPFVLGQQFGEVVPVVRWLSPLPFLIGVSNVLGINIMLPLGMKTHFALIVSLSAIVNFLAMMLLCPLYGAVGAAMSSVVAEGFVTTAMTYILFAQGKKKK